MRTRQLISLSVLYFLIGICDLYFVAIASDARIFVKPFLMIILSILFYQQVKSNYILFAKLIQIALLLSWAGDVVLLFTAKAEFYFMAGLVSFLLAHIFYIISFYKIYSEKSVGLSAIQKIIIVGLFLFYMVYIFNELKTTLGSMLVPVLIYTMVITVMGIFAGLNAAKYKTVTFGIMLIGAILFIVSDTELAFDKFVQHVPFRGIIIMTTYILAQYLIVFGSIRYLAGKK